MIDPHLDSGAQTVILFKDNKGGLRAVAADFSNFLQAAVRGSVIDKQELNWNRTLLAKLLQPFTKWAQTFNLVKDRNTDGTCR
jgi:hypothetical protein